MNTRREIALMRLVAQRLAGERCADAAAAARWMTAVQAQDLRGAITSLALRTTERSRDGVIAALDRGEIVRTWPMRGTLHLVAAADLRTMVELVGGIDNAVRAQYGRLGLDQATFERARAVVVERLGGGVASGRAEVRECLTAAGIELEGQRFAHTLAHLARTGTVCFGPMRGAEQLVVLVDEWVERTGAPAGAPGLTVNREQSLGELAVRYFRSHGPATTADFARWCAIGLTVARAAVELARGDLETLIVDDVEYLFEPGLPAMLEMHRADAMRTLLLPGFDEIVLGYADRSMTVQAQHANQVVPGNNGMFIGTVLDGGRAVGTWKRAGTAVRPKIAATPFTKFSARVESRLPALFDALP